MDAAVHPKPFALGGYVSFWSGCYVAGCTALAGILLQVDDLLRPTLAAFSLGLFVYMLHRVRRARVTVHATERGTYLLDRPKMQVVMPIAFGASAVATTWLVHPFAVLLVLAAPAGALLYASGPFGGQPRDMLAIKNLLVGCAIAALSLVLMLPQLDAVPVQMLPLACFLIGVVAVDAMLCDIDDRGVDASTDTRTLPLWLGSRRVRRLAVGLECMAVGPLLIAGMADVMPGGVVLVWSGLFVLSMLCMQLLVRPQAWRDGIDIRLPVCVLLGWFILRMWSMPAA